MGVDQPVNGAVIETTDLPDMHETVRQLINNLTSEELGIESLGPFQLPSIVHEFQLQKVTSTTTVSTTPATFNEDNNHVRTDWEQILEYVMDNGGSGFVLPPCILVAWMSVEVGHMDSDISGWDHQLWLNIHWVKDGAPDVESCDSMEISPQNLARDVGKKVTLFKVMDYSGEAGDFTIDSVELWGALNPGSSTPEATPVFNITNGVGGLIALYRQS